MIGLLCAQKAIRGHRPMILKVLECNGCPAKVARKSVFSQGHRANECTAFASY